MTIYNINFNIGWVNSGIEFAQKYRANLFRRMNYDQKYIFLDFISAENIQTLSEHMGFEDNEIIWMYQYFTDIKIAPTTFKLDDFIDSLDENVTNIERKDRTIILRLKGDRRYIKCKLKSTQDEYIERAEHVYGGYLIKVDVFTYTKLYSEFYAPKNKKAVLYIRQYYNEDGSVAYTEHLNENGEIYVFKNRRLYGKDELWNYFLESLNFTSDDTVIIDRTLKIGKPLLLNKNDSRYISVIHSEHYSQKFTNDDYIIWNHYNEYLLNNSQYIDNFVVSTEPQKILLSHHFKKYYNKHPKVTAIPVGSLKRLKYCDSRRSYSIISASRLSKEKKIDWLIEAVIKAKKYISELTLDVYGAGSEKDKLKKIIEQNNAGEYIKLKGHRDLEDIYKQYELFASASVSEGFGLTTMEAIGSGLGVIGFDVNYGNPTFVKEGKNGHTTALSEDIEINIQNISELIVKYFNGNISEYRAHSYSVAEEFLEENTLLKWKKLIEGDSNV